MKLKLDPKRAQILSNMIVPTMFLVICVFGAIYSGLKPGYLASQVMTRLARNAFLVLSLLLPVMAGLGINFSMTLGAMAGQIGLIFVTDWGVKGAAGLFLAILVSLPFAIGLGYFAGAVLNRAKGREMITSMILAFFISGIYQFFVLYLCGPFVPIKSSTLVLSRGYGIRASIGLPATKGGFDLFFDRLLNTGLTLPLGKWFGVKGDNAVLQIPIFTLLLIAGCCIFVAWFRHTKLGQDMKAVGQDMRVADSAGIQVDKVRIQSVILSTVMASIGQIIYLQNIGTLNTYNGADQAALYAAAALLIGGATVSRATISNAIFGTLLFHTMFIVMPLAGKNITGNSVLGEYFRTFVSYSIVTVTLVIHAWRRQKQKEIELRAAHAEPAEDSKKAAEA